VDQGALKGIAVTGVTTQSGKKVIGEWDYSTDGGAAWTKLPAVSPTSALVLGDNPGTRVRFLPAKGFVGLASMSYLAWDQSDGSVEGTLADPSATPTAYSTATERAWVAVGKTKPAVNAAGATLLAATKEDKTSRTFTVKSLLGIAGLESLPATNLGVAITDLGPATGVWKYKLAKTKAFVTVDSNVSASHALLLRPTDSLQFVPSANANGEADLTFQTWVPGTDFGTYVNLGFEPGIGAGLGAAALPITPVNDAPVVDPSASPTLGSVNPGDPPLTSTVAALGLAMSDVDNPALGIQILKASGGTWEYQKGGGAWTKVTKAVYLSATDSIRFTSAANAQPGTATLTFKSWDGKLVSKASDDLTVTIL
jgi:hypothetical protein